tara:strand:+ start:158 stop:754 length:597 start_codon:yes stop_codon:yes gene_type:complete
MKILAFVDMHGSMSALKSIRKKAKNVDIIVCAGDFTIFEQGIEHIMDELDKLKKEVLIVHGNHEDDDMMRELCLTHKNLFFLHNNHFIQDDVLFLGWGGGGFSEKDNSFEKREKRFKELIKKHKEKAIVLVTHAPPYGTKIDKIGREHCGNRSFAKFIKKNKIDLSISGHLHETSGKMGKIDKSTVMNPGPHGKVVNL